MCGFVFEQYWLVANIFQLMSSELKLPARHGGVVICEPG